MNLSKILTCLAIPFLAFGTKGHTSEITEGYESEHMQKRVRHVFEVMGNAAIIVQSAQEKVKAPSLPRATKSRTFMIDPTFVASEDITDANGNVIFKKGVRANPLYDHPLKSSIVLLDGDDASQVAWAEKESSSDSIWIIASEGFAEACKTLNRFAALDPNGVYAGRFQVKALPAVIKQVGDQIQVQEFVVKRPS